jgi:hypothetical protein
MVRTLRLVVMVGGHLMLDMVELHHQTESLSRVVAAVVVQQLEILLAAMADKVARLLVMGKTLGVLVTTGMEVLVRLNLLVVLAEGQLMAQHIIPNMGKMGLR